MKAKIDFKKFKVFEDIKQEKTNEVNVTFVVSDMLYKNMNGIMAHDLALRIYRADGPLEFSDEELALLKTFIEGNFTPIFIDSFNANIKELTDN